MTSGHHTKLVPLDRAHINMSFPDPSDSRAVSPVVPTSSVKPAADIKEKAYQDCLPCKVIGATTFGGLGAYTIYEARRVARRGGREGTAVGLGVASIAFISASIYRLLN
ncbi:hypothetical protein BC937DRAFT_94971 [Endogone sp. FLAS-F59071]|nr:hypothetical protein BC937DRAFT_94971 [Endogone sp. FLAS-F59071]|eukprot:RUS13662.1 hypothetical protein BC937DRAFT_94971 [Endogone sp. FLAS-F59071]